jgi:hypothetical protein
MTSTCPACRTTWTGTAACHCASCHHTFAGVGLFDAHRSQYGERGACLDPATITIKSGPRTGEPVMHFRDGMWRGPEMTEAEKLARFGAREST